MARSDRPGQLMVAAVFVLSKITTVDVYQRVPIYKSKQLTATSSFAGPPLLRLAPLRLGIVGPAVTTTLLC